MIWSICYKRSSDLGVFNNRWNEKRAQCRWHKKDAAAEARQQRDLLYCCSFSVYSDSEPFLCFLQENDGNTN